MKVDKRSIYVFVGLCAFFLVYLGYVYTVAINVHNPNSECSMQYWNETVSSGDMFDYVYFNPFANSSALEQHAEKLCLQIQNASENTGPIGTVPP